MSQQQTKSGFVALLGRPNAGKSTLLNQLIGLKVAAVSDKPQTTRMAIRGILTRPEGQIIFVDTPGIHKPVHQMNQRMMRAVQTVSSDADVLLLLVDATVPFGKGDQFVLDWIKTIQKPAVLWLNKIDKLKDRASLLPLIERYRNEVSFADFIPGSALTSENVELLISRLFELLPPGPLYYAETDITDQPERTLAAEIVREKLLQVVHDEIPYETAVYTEQFSEEPTLTRIHCTILVERDSQKAIIIGRGGQQLKRIGTLARQELEFLLGRKVFLQLYVKVRRHWREDSAMLDQLGIHG
ncbi:MAG: GTPase Era [Acidobacteriota bacterium]|nr:GTPase Era [Blastocatellia bacterium]MDW8238529.1 GTPase Era [Acidobacteriota bacterium]